MIIFITTPGHEYALKPLVQGRFTVALPRIMVSNYDIILRRDRLPRATYVFADLERLTPWEQELAIDLYRMIAATGLRCLNDPARIKLRYELLRSLYREGQNSFNVHLAVDRPRPTRFPVFLRREFDHDGAIGELLPDQAALDAQLRHLRQHGAVLRGMLVVEWHAAPIAPGIWRKFGTFRIGDAVHVDHADMGDHWIVKENIKGVASEAIYAEERDAVADNRYADALRPVFNLAGIEYGRADHGHADGRNVVYEINTNPLYPEPVPQPSTLRDEAKAIARARLAQLFFRIDSAEGLPVQLTPTERVRSERVRNGDRRWLVRP
jgi:hypothetical protein